MKEIAYARAAAEALQEEFRRNNKLIYLATDVQPELRGEFGEDRVRVTPISESAFVGTAIGLGIAYYGQVVGFNISSLLKENTLLLPNVIRARITMTTVVLGFLPGLLATFLGTAISGIGIYKRQTSELFKELEA